ncbi:MAG: DnaJ domain-containing protein [Synergistaceae bacterium]|jgi:curved DNA-binding protein CbpA|nr:DnaJ domain-containing protein [Synergistaceae bacterium]
MAGDYYSILGISRTATQEEIQAACSRMAELYNPDVNRDNVFAMNIYKKVAEAREILSDTEKRRAYDASLTAQGGEKMPSQPATSPLRAPASTYPAKPLPPSAPRQETGTPVGAGVSSYSAGSPTAFQGKIAVETGKMPQGSPASSDSPTIEEQQKRLRAYFSQSFSAEKEKNSTLRNSILGTPLPWVVLGSLAGINLLTILFGLRVTGIRTSFLLSSSSLILIGWGIYTLLRRQTTSFLLALLYSLCYAIIYSIFTVRLYFNPTLYEEARLESVVFTNITIHFIIFYVVFFCSTQLLDKDGFSFVREHIFRNR